MKIRPLLLLWTLIAATACGSLLSACGQKGDLFQPDDPRASRYKK